MEKFIGRQEELNDLIFFANDNDRNLISIIGRRGVGKSRLNKEFEKKILNADDENKFLLIKFQGNKNLSKKQQIENCLKDLFFYLKKDFILDKKIESWHDFFKIFEKEINEFYKKHKNKRKIIVLIDEFAWLHNLGSGFVDEFAVFYDSLMDKNILFVITGSAVSWMNKNVIKSKGGLHHKVHRTIRLEAFNLIETKEFLLNKNSSLSNYEIIQYYFYTGGVARYLEKIRTNESIKQNIIYIYENGGNSHNSEFNELFNSIFESKKNIHEKIVFMFKKKNGLTKTEIEKEIKKLNKEESFSHASVLSAIEDLVVSGILLEKSNYGKEKKDKVYYLVDLFCYFYIKLFNDKAINEKNINNEQLKGFAFEILIMLNIELIKKQIGYGGIKANFYSWKNKESQIDLILDFGNNHFALFEFKYYDLPFEIDKKNTENILNKKNQFLNSIKRVKKEMEIYIVSLNGTKNKDGRLFYKDVIIDDILN